MDAVARFNFTATDTTLLVSDSPDGDGSRLVSGLVVPFGVPVERFFGQAVFTADATRLPEQLDTIKLLTEHDPTQPVGYAVAAQLHDDGLYMSFNVPTTVDRAAGYLEDLDANLRDGFSVGIELDAAAQDSIMRRMFDASGDSSPVVMSGIVREVSGCSVPAFNDARADSSAARRVLHFTTDSTTPRKEVPMTAEPLTPELPTTEELAARVGEFLSAQRSASVHPLARFGSYDEYSAAVWEGTTERFALVDQITPDNPGLVPPAWLSQVVGIIDRGRPGITAFGGPQSLPATGMDLDWPVFAGDLSTIVAEQVAQKTEIHSVKVSFTKGTAPLKTYAGGSDVSYQLLRRSSPAYRDQYLQILSIAYAITTDNAFVDSLLAAATPLVHAITDSSTLRVALFDASLRVQQAVGAPANVVLVAPDVFAAWGSYAGLYPPMYGTNNATGTSAASDLRINVSGLEVTPDANLPAGAAIVSNTAAAGWFEDGPFNVEQDDVAKLGRDIGVWGMGATRVALPAGVLSIVAA